MLKGKVLLITGGTGSFGSEVVRQLLKSNIKEIRIFSRDEKKQEDMRLSLNNDKAKFIIGDVRDAESINAAMKGVDYAFHAAALKQVPSCEFYPMEAIKTNIIGTENVLNASLNCKVKKVVFLSTDKAVYPVNAMGMSKAMMEKLMIAKARISQQEDTIFCATRYGNVMASRGSVIPLFINQIKEGKDLTVTEPNMTRFLMSLHESVDLVLHAFEHGNQGDIFVQKSPASTIEDLAKALLRIFKSNNSIKIIGARHSEKMYESLLSSEEMAKAQSNSKYYKIPMDARDLNYNKYFIEGTTELSKFEEYNSNNTNRLDIDQLQNVLLDLDYIKEELNV